MHTFSQFRATKSKYATSEPSKMEKDAETLLVHLCLWREGGADRGEREEGGRVEVNTDATPLPLNPPHHQHQFQNSIQCLLHNFSSVSRNGKTPEYFCAIISVRIDWLSCEASTFKQTQQRQEAKEDTNISWKPSQTVSAGQILEQGWIKIRLSGVSDFFYFG